MLTGALALILVASLAAGLVAAIALHAALDALKKVEADREHAAWMFAEAQKLTRLNTLSIDRVCDRMELLERRERLELAKRALRKVEHPVHN